MDDNDLKITLSLDDQASDQAKQAFADVGNAAQQATSKANTSLVEMGTQLRSVGMEIGKASAALGFMGALVAAPFVLALHNASAESINVSNEMARLTTVTNKFQADLATAVLPVVHQLANELNGLVKGFEALSPSARDATAQAVLLTGEFLLGVAAIGYFTKEIIALVANLMKLAGQFLVIEGGVIALNIPLLAMVAIIATIVAVMIKWQAAGEGIVSGFEVLFRFLLTGVATVKLAFIGMAEAAVDSLEAIVAAIAKVPGPQQKMVQAAVAGIDQWRTSLEGLGSNEMAGVQNQVTKLGNLLVSGRGAWSRTYDDVTKSAKLFFDASKKGNDDIVVESKKTQTELVTLSNQLRDLNIQNANKAYLNEKQNLTDSVAMAKFYQTNWMQAHETVTAFAIASAQSIKNDLGSAITDMITGAKTAGQAFADLGKQMITMIVNYFVQKGISMALDAVFGKSLLAASVAAQVAAGAAITAAFAPAALVASIATFGAADAAAAAGFATASAAEISSMAAVSTGGAAHLSEGTDTVPSMLSPGEMVLPNTMADAIRSGKLTLSGPSGNGSQQGNTYITNINIDKPTISKTSDIQALTEEISRRFYREVQRIR